MNRPTTLLVLLLAACAPSSEEGPLDGAALYKRQNCAACHGMNRQGSGLAPAIDAVGQHWTVDGLAEYLADPQGYAANDERLKAQGERYRMPMTPYKHLSVEERKAIAAYVIDG